MGGKSSTRRKVSKLFGSSSSSTHGPGYPPPLSVTKHYHYYTPRHHMAPRPVEYSYRTGTPPPERLVRRNSRIQDNNQCLDQVTKALAEAGLESSNLIVGIDFTKSNEWTGARSFNKKNLHQLGTSLNPYEQAIKIIGKTLSDFDEDNLIPCFGFGDASTHDTDVFSFYPEKRYCSGFEEVLRRYRELVPQLHLSGPTSFAPVIEMAMKIVEESGYQYHVLLIIADGQVTRSSETPYGQFSLQEQKTFDAIVKASEYPLSIILVGVGDGPWDMMREFSEKIPAREFDNFQFVDFTEIMSKNVNPKRKETEFALAALTEIPAQYRATIALNILGNKTWNGKDRTPLPPPSYTSMSNASTSLPVQTKPIETFSGSSSQSDSQLCPICLNNPKNMAFGCGHQSCKECGVCLSKCPICRSQILTKIKLYV